MNKWLGRPDKSNIQTNGTIREQRDTDIAVKTP
jgi:hypothetical protein